MKKFFGFLIALVFALTVAFAADKPADKDKKTPAADKKVEKKDDKKAEPKKDDKKAEPKKTK
jgi:hypothetical protein